jgi:hypothetical protein
MLLIFSSKKIKSFVDESLYEETEEKNVDGEKSAEHTYLSDISSDGF